MTEKNTNKKIATMDGNILKDLVMRLKLISRLMGDRRVNPFLKLLPMASLVYLFFPIDFIPGGLMTVIGAADDVAILWFGVTMFLELCPQDVVQEHIRQLTANADIPDNDDVVDAEIVEFPDDEK